MRRDLLTIAVMLTVASGCDNVEWGGMDLQLKPPPARADAVAEAPGLAAALAEEEEPAIVLPDGPLLMAGERSGSTATLTLVGEVQADAIGGIASEEAVPGFREALVAERLAPGSEWVLFSQGVRVGRMTATEVGLDESFCVSRPTVTGPVELVPTNRPPTRVLALPAEVARDRDFTANPALQHNYAQRVASLSIASGAIPRVGATWPPDGVLSARADIQAFRFAGEDQARIAATFVYGDRLGIAEPGQNAYSLFVMGRQVSDTTYTSTYVGYRPADDEGKGVPRYFDHLDWDGDGDHEVLLDVFGSDSRWFTSLAERSGSWVTTSLDPCSGAAPDGG